MKAYLFLGWSDILGTETMDRLKHATLQTNIQIYVKKFQVPCRLSLYCLQHTMATQSRHSGQPPTKEHDTKLDIQNLEYEVETARLGVARQI